MWQWKQQRRQKAQEVKENDELEENNCYLQLSSSINRTNARANLQHSIEKPYSKRNSNKTTTGHTDKKTNIQPLLQ